MEKEIDETIGIICKRIQEMLKTGEITDMSIVRDMAKALAELISARKGLT